MSPARWPQGQVRRLSFPKQTLAPGRGGNGLLERLTFKVQLFGFVVVVVVVLLIGNTGTNLILKTEML